MMSNSFRRYRVRGSVYAATAGLVATSLLTAGAGTADAVPMRGWVGGSVTTPVATVAADTPVRASATSVNRLWWVADAIVGRSDADLLSLAFHDQVLQEMYKRSPVLTPETAAAQVRQLRARIGAGVKALGATGDQRVPLFLASAAQVLQASTTPTALREAGEVALQHFSGRFAVATPSGLEQVTQTVDVSLQPSATFSLAPEVLERGHALAMLAGMAPFRRAQALAFPDELAAVTTPAKQLIAGNPQLRAMTGLTALITGTGAISTDMATVQDLADATYARAIEAQSAGIATIGEIEQHQSRVLDYAQNPGASAALKAEVKEDAASHKEVIKVLEGEVKLLTALFKLVAPEFAGDFNKVATAAVQVADAVWSFAKLAVDLGGAAAAAGATGGISLIAKVAEVVIGLLPMFGGDGSAPRSPNQAVLDQIKKLREQVTALGKHIDKRFTRIEAALSTMYRQMMEQFNAINVQLGVIDGDVQDVRAKLVAVHNRLIQLESGLWSSLSAGFLHDLHAEIDYALGYENRTGNPLPADAFLRADSTFYRWATHHAYDNTSVAAVGEAALETAGDRLATYSLDANVAYLNQLPRAFGLPAVTDRALPNPNVWFLGARAYIALAEANPTQAQANLELGREITDIGEGGRALQAFERGIRQGPTTLYAGAQLNPLFAALVREYDARGRAVTDALAASQTQFETGKPVKPFAGIDQPVNAPNATTFIDCGVDDEAISEAAADTVVPSPLQIAQSLRRPSAGTASLCVTGAEWVNEQPGGNGRLEWVDAQLQVTMRTRWQPAGAGRPTDVLETTAITRPIRVCSRYVLAGEFPEPCELPDPMLQVSHSWDDVNLAFRGAVTRSRLHEGMLGQIEDQARAHLTTVQAALYQHQATTFATEDMRSLTSQVAGMKRVIEAYLQLGMPAALVNDEVMAAMLRGDQGLFVEGNEGMLSSWFLVAAAAPPASNALDPLKTEMSRRSGALAEAIARNLPVAEAEADGSVLTATTLQRLASLRPSVTSASAGFGPVATLTKIPGTEVGSTRTITLRVHNLGLGAMTVSGVTVAGTGLSLARETCGVVPGGSSCVVSIRFAPRAAGKVTGSVTVSTNTLTGGTVRRLTATGLR